MTFTHDPGPVASVFYRLVRFVDPDYTLTLRNAGDMPLTGIAAALSGPGMADFALDTSETADTLEPGATTTLSVAFDFMGDGTRAAVLTLSGEGIAPVTLNLRGDNAPTLTAPPAFDADLDLSPATPAMPVAVSGTLTGPPRMEVIVQGSRDLDQTDAWTEIARITLEPRRHRDPRADARTGIDGGDALLRASGSRPPRETPGRRLGAWMPSFQRGNECPDHKILRDKYRAKSSSFPQPAGKNPGAMGMRLPLIPIVSLLLTASAQATTFTVKVTSDSGANSLRQAITDANADASATVGAPHRIVFAIGSGGAQAIVCDTPLPTLTEPRSSTARRSPAFPPSR
ncbi:MAG: hypothetical protein R3F11_26425 [Verrucomicrobiales bacterium]